MTSSKCIECGLVNFATAGACRRCGAAFFGGGGEAAAGWDEATEGRRAGGRGAGC